MEVALGARGGHDDERRVVYTEHGELAVGIAQVTCCACDVLTDLCREQHDPTIASVGRVGTGAPVAGLGARVRRDLAAAGEERRDCDDTEADQRGPANETA